MQVNYKVNIGTTANLEAGQPDCPLLQYRTGVDGTTDKVVSIAAECRLQVQH